MKLNRNRFGSDMFGAPDSVNPMDGVANLADVMLVLACGLMLALVINWNIDVSNRQSSGSSSDMTEVEQVQEGDENTEIDTDKYAEVGKVYQDPETGVYYMVVEDENRD